jgi:hypothetical protein
MAAMEVCTKLHDAGLLKKLYLEGEEKHGPGFTSADGAWFSLDAKSAMVNFSVQQNCPLYFTCAESGPGHGKVRASGIEMHAYLTVPIRRFIR